MRRASWFALFNMMALMIYVVHAAPLKQHLSAVNTRIRKQCEALARGIDKESEDQKLLYMVLLLHSGNYQKSIEFYEKNYKTEEGDFFIRMAYVQAEIVRNKYSSAALCELYKLSGKHGCNRLKARALCLDGLGCMLCTHGLGFACFRRAISRHGDPTYAPAYYLLGETAEELPNSHTEAIRYYVQTLALEQPSTPLARKARHSLLYELEGSLKQPPQDINSRIRGQLETLAQEIDKQPDDRKLLYMVLLLHGGDYEKTIVFYQKNYKDDKGDLFTRMTYAHALTASKRYAKAADVLKKLSEKHACKHLMAQVAYLRGMEARSTERSNRAWDFFRAATKPHIDPTYAPAYYMLGEIAKERTNDRAEAIRYYVQTLAVEPPSTPLARKALECLLDELEAKSNKPSK